MNIFATSQCPIKSAEYLDNKRVVKMILETAQILCTALNHYGVDVPYKPTHPNHPSNVWARSSRQNWSWLWEHGCALSNEYTKRYGKIHKSHAVLLEVIKHRNVIPDGELMKHSNNARRADMDIDYTHLDDVHEAYKLYLSDRWDNDKIAPRWYDSFDRPTKHLGEP